MAEGSVVIPTLNEARNLPHVFAELPPGLHEVIIVDGNSVDDTVATARRLRPDVRIVSQNRCGKGNALACGFAAATGDIIAMVDATARPTRPRSRSSSRLCWMAPTSPRVPRSTAAAAAAISPGCAASATGCSSGLVNTLCRTEYSDLCYGYNAFCAATSRRSASTPNPTSRSAAAPGCGATDLKSRP